MPTIVSGKLTLVNQTCNKYMMKNKNIVILTGAGISAESGIMTFRDTNGLWENHNVEDVATPHGFARNPDLVHRFYNERMKQATEVRPNSAHDAITRLQREWKGDVTLITQNIDQLHCRSGSKTIEMHGSIFRAKCNDCQETVEDYGPLDRNSRCDICGGPMRVDVVWFGEMPYGLEEISSRLFDCDIFIVVGTSGEVSPANNFIDTVSRNLRCDEIIEVNPKPTRNHLFTRTIAEPATIGMTGLVDELLKRQS